MMNRIYKNYIFDIIFAVLALALGIIMLPPFNIGQKIINILLAVTLVAYLVVHLFGKLRRSRGATFVLTLIEFSVVSLISVGLVLQQFKVFNISGVCRTVGLVLWLRGIVSILGMYIRLGTVKSESYNLPKFALYLLLITLGACAFASPVISDLAFNWIICIVMILTAVIFGALALIYSPEKKKKTK